MFVWGVGLLCCKLVMHMMLAHLCASNFSLMRKTLIPVFACAIHAAAQCITGILSDPPCIDPLMSEGTAAKLLALLSVTTYFHMIICLVQEIKAILGIACFTVKPYKDE